jgi:hypothetical protein
MDVKEYCKNIDIELNAWRAKLNDVMSQKGALGCSAIKRSTKNK